MANLASDTSSDMQLTVSYKSKFTDVNINIVEISYLEGQFFKKDRQLEKHETLQRDKGCHISRLSNILGLQFSSVKKMLYYQLIRTIEPEMVGLHSRKSYGM